MPITYGDLTPEQVQTLGHELDAIRNRVRAELGQADLDYIRTVIKAQRGLEVSGRAMLELGWLAPLWLGGTAALALSKILDNMEIGHNVMHGQYDWTNDPALNSQTFEWDTACPAEQWRHSHNYMHHTFTNILDMDRDIGYGILRMSEEQRWSPYFVGNLLYATLLMLLFEWGVAVHDLEVEELFSGSKSIADKRDMLKAIWRKGGRQALKDYVIFPALAGPGAPLTLAGNATANIIRNIWAFSIIFCGHFPDGVQEFSKAEAANETKGEWYLRQMLGSANITGGRLFHILSGNLSFQIEHHLFPDIPARRYAAISTEVREICERYGLPYNAGPLHRQLGSVFLKLARLSLPWIGNSPFNRSYRRPTRRPADVAVTVPAAATREPVAV
ncbi:acyl-CoA desaturase [Conexibacter sp. DBS9H8]|uniref:fatty acid desaturase family protein n=1 Tax=Conexibacter sp. DBS9H8 TaxID=2937801 RepID=UPI00200BE68F|nr:acyl-CoA desaturase [Conexibacter sp. DBS9H8]